MGIGHLTAGVVMAAVAVAASQQPPAAAGGQRPAFRSGVQVVEVDVRVFDTSGRFVGNLTRDDFALFENGAPQQIVSLSLVGPADAASVAAVLPPAAVPAPPAPRPVSPHQAWIFVFDLNHLAAGAGFERARTAVEAFLRDRFIDGDLGGIVAGTRMVNNRLTSVREELVAAAASVKPLPDLRSRQIELTREWPRLQDELEAIQIADNNAEALKRAVLRACNDDADMCKGTDPELMVREKSRRLAAGFERSTTEALASLNAVASGLARMPGPKSIVLLSEGFVVERMEGPLRQAVGQAARAGARIYAIDVRGLNRGRGAGIIDQALADDPAGGPPSPDMLADGPNSLAVDTGGLMIRNENNIGQALERVARDANSYYVIGYQPADAAFDGKYRPIDVRVRRPGVRVRARRGYLALEPARVLVAEPIAALPARPAPGSPPPADAVAPPPDVVAPPPGVVAPIAPIARIGAVEHVDALISSEAAAAVRLAPEASTALAREGWARYAKGDVEGARAALAEAAASDAPAWVFYALGQSEFALQNFQRAAAAWETVRRRMPEFKAVYFDLADAHIQMRAYGDAVTVLREASTRFPADPEVFNALGVVLARREAMDDAIAAFRTAIALSPSDGLGHFNLGRALELRYSKGLRYNAAMQRWIGREGDRTEALAEFRRYLEIGGPQDASARESISKLEWK